MNNKKIEKKVTAIIPAFNEEMTVGQVVSVVKDHPLIDEVIVVDDGSYDGTDLKAKQAGARVLRLSVNQGKGPAMSKGVSAANNNIILFLDADIVGLNHEILSKMITEVADNNYDMYVGITDRKLYLLNKLLMVTPILGGERALKKNVWLAIPSIYKRGFQIEIAMNYYCKKNGMKMGFSVMPGLTQIIKEKKRGLFLGLIQRIKMMTDIFVIAVRLYVFDRFRAFFKDIGEEFSFKDFIFVAGDTVIRKQEYNK